MGNSACPVCGHSDGKNFCVKCEEKLEKLEAQKKMKLRENIKEEAQKKKDLRFKKTIERQSQIETEIKKQEDLVSARYQDKELLNYADKVKKIKEAIEKAESENDIPQWSKGPSYAEQIKEIRKRVANVGQVGETLLDSVNDIEVTLNSAMGSDVACIEDVFKSYRKAGKLMSDLNTSFIEETKMLFGTNGYEKGTVDLVVIKKEYGILEKYLDAVNSDKTKLKETKEMNERERMEAEVKVWLSGLELQRAKVKLMKENFKTMEHDYEQLISFCEKSAEEHGCGQKVYDEILKIANTIPPVREELKTRLEAAGKCAAKGAHCGSVVGGHVAALGAPAVIVPIAACVGGIVGGIFGWFSSKKKIKKLEKIICLKKLAAAVKKNMEKTQEKLKSAKKEATLDKKKWSQMREECEKFEEELTERIDSLKETPNPADLTKFQFDVHKTKWEALKRNVSKKMEAIEELNNQQATTTTTTFTITTFDFRKSFSAPAVPVLPLTNN